VVNPVPFLKCDSIWGWIFGFRNFLIFHKIYFIYFKVLDSGFGMSQAFKSFSSDPECVIFGTKGWTPEEIKEGFENIGLIGNVSITPRPNHPDSVYATFESVEDRDYAGSFNRLRCGSATIDVRIIPNNVKKSQRGNHPDFKQEVVPILVSNMFQGLEEEVE